MPVTQFGAGEVATLEKEAYNAASLFNSAKVSLEPTVTVCTR